MNLIKKTIDRNLLDLKKRFISYRESVTDTLNYDKVYQKIIENIKKIQIENIKSYGEAVESKILSIIADSLNQDVFKPYNINNDKIYLKILDEIKTHKIKDEESTQSLYLKISKSAKDIIKQQADNGDELIVNRMEKDLLVFIGEIIKSIKENIIINSEDLEVSGKKGKRIITLKDNELVREGDAQGEKKDIINHIKDLGLADDDSEANEVFIELLKSGEIIQQTIDGKLKYILMTNLQSRLINHKIFPNGKPLPSEVKQGFIGDCYLLSTLITLAKNNPKALMDCFVQSNFNRKDNIKLKLYTTSYEIYKNKLVVLPGKPVIITIQANSLLKNGTKVINNAIWPAIFEKAFVAYFKKSSKNSTALDALNQLGEGNTPMVMMTAITGKMSKTIETNSVQESLKGINQDGLSISSTSKPIPDEANRIFQKISNAIKKNKAVTIGDGRHAYAILETKIKGADKYVTLQNPYENEKPFDVEFSQFLEKYQGLAKGTEISFLEPEESQIQNPKT